MGKSISRKGVGVGLVSATEAEVDAYLSDPILYPTGMFDDAIDGNGAPMHITPLPWGSEGSIHIYAGTFDDKLIVVEASNQGQASSPRPNRARAPLASRGSTFQSGRPDVLVGTSNSRMSARSSRRGVRVGRKVGVPDDVE